MTDSIFASVSASGPGEAWAVGTFANADALDAPLVEHWNGTAWSIVPTPDITADGDANQLAGVSADGAATCRHQATPMMTGRTWRDAAGWLSWDAGRMPDLDILRDRMRQFAGDRDWGSFHDPKSVILALVGEVGELAELFQWLPAADARALARQQPLRTRAAEEMADVLLYLVLLADVLGVDLAAAAERKIADAERRYPASQVAGRAPDREGRVGQSAAPPAENQPPARAAGSEPQQPGVHRPDVRS
ncbi:MAG: nucleotide pyrophosphohydrolase [Streptosporangiaceae bacterium]